MLTLSQFNFVDSIDLALGVILAQFIDSNIVRRLYHSRQMCERVHTRCVR